MTETDNEEKKKKKKKIVIVIIIVILIILLILGGIALWKYIQWLKAKKETNPMKIQPNVVTGDEDPRGERVTGINVNIRNGLKIDKNDNGKYTLTLDLKNGNDFQYMFTITVGNQEIYASGLIPAGGELPAVELDDVNLDSGSYEAIVVFSAISEKDNETVLGSTGLELDLQVTK